jgi:two-component system, NarL family, invasion response regulator UvrY
MIKILLVDDHAMVRSGLKKILKDESDFEVIGEASNYMEALSILHEPLPDIILLDISMPGRNGLDVLKDIKTLYRKVRVLILSMHPEERYAVRAIKLGASGYVSKESADSELVYAIRRIYNGNKYISTTLAEKLANVVDDETGKLPHEKLSDREFQVLCMIASGKSIKDIAEELSLSPATIASFRGRIMMKLNLKSNVEITSYALRNQLID